jgi:hypothetical protein
VIRLLMSHFDVNQWLCENGKVVKSHNPDALDKILMAKGLGVKLLCEETKDLITVSDEILSVNPKLWQSPTRSRRGGANAATEDGGAGVGGVADRD